jgi:hypothetical protein
VYFFLALLYLARVKENYFFTLQMKHLTAAVFPHDSYSETLPAFMYYSYIAISLRARGYCARMSLREVKAFRRNVTEEQEA